jgi:hypothetical protein
MIEYLCSKAEYCSFPNNASGADIEDTLAAFALEKDVDALIDAGALLNNKTNKVVASIFSEEVY